VILEAYGAALLIAVGAAVVGRAICTAAGGGERWWTAPAVGLAALIIVSAAAIELPGRAVPAVGLTAILILASAAFLWRRRQWPGDRVQMIAGVVSLIGASLPFLANGRVGLQGVSLDDDTAHFLLFAESLRSARMEHLWGSGGGYPLGPPSLAATVSSGIGAPLDLAFCGLLLAIVVITAMVAAGVLGNRAPWRRIVTGVMCSLAYLVAAYYGEGAFKETVMAVLLLAFVLALEHLSEARASLSWRTLLPAVILVAGGVYTYSYTAIAWFAGTVVIWLLAETASRPRQILSAAGWQRMKSTAGAVWRSVLVLVVLLVPVADQIRSFFSSVGFSPAASAAIPASDLGNLIHRLSVYESLGIWWSPDFRRDPANGFHAGELAAFALAVVAFGLVWALRRRQRLLPAAVVTSLIIWWRADATQSPYVAAKALVIVAPLVMALDLRALFTVRPPERAVRALVLAVAAAFCACAAYSSYLVLHNEPVNETESGRELAAFASRIDDARVLYLGHDEYAPWELRPAAVAAIDRNVVSQAGAVANRAKPFSGQLDFDSVTSSSLDRFSYVITSNSAYASQPPSNFRLVATRRLYALWRRVGPTPPRLTLDPAGAPGAVLDCATPSGRRLSRSHGVASVTAAPVTTLGPGLLPGSSATFELPLPEGEWELSIQYNSDFTLELRAEGKRWAMPAVTALPQAFFAVGQVQGHGAGSPVGLTMHLSKPSALTSEAGLLYVKIQTIAATRVPDTRRLIPLDRACGQYVDWYRFTSTL
jgi:hypothetical protein